MPIIHTPLGGTAPVELGDGASPSLSVPIGSWDGGGLWGGRPVSHARMFQDQPWVGIAVMRMLTWSVRVPLKLYERLDDNGNRRRIQPAEHPLAAAIVEPWPRAWQAQLVHGMLGPLLVHGNGLVDVMSGAGDRIRFDLVDWRTAQPVFANPRDSSTEVLGWRVTGLDGADLGVLSSDTTMHPRWWSPLGQIGVSPLRQLRTTLATERAAIDWAMTYLQNAARPSGVVEVDDKFLGLDPEERQRLLDQVRGDLRAAYAGPARAGVLPVLPPGLKWSSADHSTAVEAQLIEQRIANREEVAAVYQIPPPMIGILKDATFSNIETQREMAYTDALAPPLVLLEQVMTAHICRHLLADPALFVEFDFGLILRGDRLKEIQAIREAIGTAVTTPNEGRRVLNLPPSTADGADALWIPANNLTRLDQTSTTGAAPR